MVLMKPSSTRVRAFENMVMLIAKKRQNYESEDKIGFNCDYSSSNDNDESEVW